MRLNAQNIFRFLNRLTPSAISSVCVRSRFCCSHSRREVQAIQPLSPSLSFSLSRILTKDMEMLARAYQYCGLVCRPLWLVGVFESPCFYLTRLNQLMHSNMPPTKDYQYPTLDRRLGNNVDPRGTQGDRFLLFTKFTISVQMCTLLQSIFSLFSK